MKQKKCPECGSEMKFVKKVEVSKGKQVITSGLIELETHPLSATLTGLTTGNPRGIRSLYKCTNPVCERIEYEFE